MHTDTKYRELAESGDRIEGLEEEVNRLVAVLRTVGTDPIANAAHPEIIDVLSRVSAPILSGDEHTNLCIVSGRGSNPNKQHGRWSDERACYDE